MDADLAYLLNYLEDEFRNHPDVRVSVPPKVGTRKAPDLPQTYDPETSNLHLLRGVTVRTSRREYYFPAEWVASRQFSEVERLARQIKDTLAD